MSFALEAIGRASITLEQAIALLGGGNDATLKTRYRLKSLEVHPDRGGSIEQMSRVNEAYDILTGKTKPAPNYDYRTKADPGNWGPRPGQSKSQPGKGYKYKQNSPPRPKSPPPNDPWGKWKNPKYDEDKSREDVEEILRKKREEAAKAEREAVEEVLRRKREEEAKARAENAKSPATSKRSVPKDVVERARVRMYDAYDRAKGSPDDKFEAMRKALISRLRATKDLDKRQGIVEMLRQEVQETEFNKRWSQSQRHILETIMRGV